MRKGKKFMGAMVDSIPVGAVAELACGPAIIRMLQWQTAYSVGENLHHCAMAGLVYQNTQTMGVERCMHKNIHDCVVTDMGLNRAMHRA